MRTLLIMRIPGTGQARPPMPDPTTGNVVRGMAVGLRNLNRDEVASRLSPAQAAALMAAVELGRRAFGPVPLSDLIDGPEGAAAKFANHQGWRNPRHRCPRSPDRLSGKFHEPTTHYRLLGAIIL
jgi:hypothetical protein